MPFESAHFWSKVTASILKQKHEHGASIHLAVGSTINLRMITFNLHFGIRNLKMTSTVPGSIYSHSGPNVSPPIILKHSQNTITIHFLEEENLLIFVGRIHFNWNADILTSIFIFSGISFTGSKYWQGKKTAITKLVRLRPGLILAACGRKKPEIRILETRA